MISRVEKLDRRLRGFPFVTNQSESTCVISYTCSHLTRPVPVIPIIGARKLSQLQDNLASLELTLLSDQVRRLDEASAIELGFPYDLYEKELPRTFRYGGMEDKILTK